MSTPADTTDRQGARLYLGLLGVLLGSMMAILSNRVTSFGLADLRGALGITFDEGAWITTTFGIGQLVAGVSCPYLASLFGPRRLLLSGCVLFFVASLLTPFSQGLTGFLVIHGLAGIGSGTFIPLTVIFIVRSVPKRLSVLGISIYAINSEFSQNIGASLEAFYLNVLSWHWIFWQYCLVVPVMMLCVAVGMKRDPVDWDKLRRLDWVGLVLAWVGFGGLYAALDQGNRLDWANSGLVVGLASAGLLACVAFLVRERTARAPAVHMGEVVRLHYLVLFALLAGYRFIILSTAMVIPAYLTQVQQFRSLEIGSVLLWIALPQVLLVVPLAVLLTRIDPRWTLGTGSALIAVACLMAGQLTADWTTPNFLYSQVLQAAGQSLALTSLVVLITRTIRPEQAVTVGAFMQTSRLLGGEAGIAFMETFLQRREQIHSNLLGLHVTAGDGRVEHWLTQHADLVGARVVGLGDRTSAALSLLSSAIREQALVLAYSDGFHAAAVVAVVFWCLGAFVPSRPRR